jgi:hypothetical protein
MEDEELRWIHKQVRQLSDIEEIKQLMARYARCADTKDYDAWRADVLTDDFHFEVDGRGLPEGRDAFLSFVARSFESGLTVHHCHTPEITITGADTATGIWAVQDHVTHPGDGSPFKTRGAGHYYSKCVRTDAGWRLKSIVLKRLSVDVLEGEHPNLPSAEPAP